VRAIELATIALAAARFGSSALRVALSTIVHVHPIMSTDTTTVASKSSTRSVRGETPARCHRLVEAEGGATRARPGAPARRTRPLTHRGHLSNLRRPVVLHSVSRMQSLLDLLPSVD
jgi:hypothetical protein